MGQGSLRVEPHPPLLPTCIYIYTICAQRRAPHQARPEVVRAAPCHMSHNKGPFGTSGSVHAPPTVPPSTDAVDPSGSARRPKRPRHTPHANPDDPSTRDARPRSRLYALGRAEIRCRPLPDRTYHPRRSATATIPRKGPDKPTDQDTPRAEDERMRRAAPEPKRAVPARERNLHPTSGSSTHAASLIGRRHTRYALIYAPREGERPPALEPPGDAEDGGPCTRHPEVPGGHERSPRAHTGRWSRPHAT